MFDLPLVENDSGNATKRLAGSDTPTGDILSAAARRDASRGLQLAISAAGVLWERPKGSLQQS